jgi:hypothetical protein
MARRIITGHNAAGKSCFVADEDIEGMTAWESLPGDPLGGDRGEKRPAFIATTAPGIEPARGGSKCVLVSMMPWTEMKPMLEQGGIPGLDKDGYHRTETIDYIMMISGEITLLLEEGQTIVRAGDLVVQRNTLHSWQNHSNQPAVFWGVMVSITEAS